MIFDELKGGRDEIEIGNEQVLTPFRDWQALLCIYIHTHNDNNNDNNTSDNHNDNDNSKNNNNDNHNDNHII